MRLGHLGTLPFEHSATWGLCHLGTLPFGHSARFLAWSYTSLGPFRDQFWTIFVKKPRTRVESEADSGSLSGQQNGKVQMAKCKMAKCKWQSASVKVHYEVCPPGRVASAKEGGGLRPPPGPSIHPQPETIRKKKIYFYF